MVLTFESLDEITLTLALALAPALAPALALALALTLMSLQETNLDAASCIKF